MQETMDMPNMPNMTDNGTVLFSGWPNHSAGMYTLALFSVFFLSLGMEIFSFEPPVRHPALGVAVQFVVYCFFRISFVYLEMLLVMSSNVGILIAVVLGHSLGILAMFRAISIANRESSGLEQKV
ncbi:hypothetical protein PIB30_079821 [Stylosanthes scabra]|uniref:Copper transporter n=1 Tax=Stylosanthes scabra TaxID=79078 RepID=A0ABU6VPP8_9FABA|nr:hypothetical protein [Stylosanthes scabra]